MTEPYIRHVVLLKFREGTTAADRQVMEAGLSRLPAAIPQLLRYRFGPDLGLTSGNFDFGIVADVANRETLRAYVDHPAHQEAIAKLIRPLVRERSAVQFECASGGG